MRNVQTSSSKELKGVLRSIYKLFQSRARNFISLISYTLGDLSNNPDLTGSLSRRLGDLTKLNILALALCGFTGTIPDELGNLAELTFLALNGNRLTGQIPASLGKLTKVNWLDIADNFLTGSIPVSSSTASGLDLLLEARHL